MKQQEILYSFLNIFFQKFLFTIYEYWYKS